MVCDFVNHCLNFEFQHLLFSPGDPKRVPLMLPGFWLATSAAEVVGCLFKDSI